VAQQLRFSGIWLALCFFFICVNLCSSVDSSFLFSKFPRNTHANQNYRLAGWQTNSGQDAHSFSADPNLANESPLTSGGNYSLLAVSPAIHAGVNLGSTYQMGLSPLATWPSGVSPLNQNSGSAWEIGAYVYPQSNTPTLLLRGCCN
jgi:hypothetical protein